MIYLAADAVCVDSASIRVLRLATSHRFRVQTLTGVKWKDFAGPFSIRGELMVADKVTGTMYSMKTGESASRDLFILPCELPRLAKMIEACQLREDEALND